MFFVFKFTVCAVWFKQHAFLSYFMVTSVFLTNIFKHVFLTVAEDRDVHGFSVNRRGMERALIFLRSVGCSGQKICPVWLKEKV